MSVTAKVPGEQMMECMAKVEDYVPPIIPVPLWRVAGRCGLQAGCRLGAVVVVVRSCM